MLEFMTMADTLPHPTPGVLHTASEAAKTVGAYSATLLLGWGFFRVIARPFVDDSRFESWKRKRAETERFMRETMFATDLVERKSIKSLAEQGVQLAASNAQAIGALTTEISRVFAQQGQQNLLLNSIPHLAGSVEQMTDSIEAIRIDVRSVVEAVNEHGQALATHSALLGQLPELNRRHEARRFGDPLPDSL